MEIILKQYITNLGHKDDIIVVKNGYGRNYLIPQGFAILATKSAKKIHAENLKQRAHKEEKIKNEAMALAETIKAVEIKIGAKTSSTGKIFGSVNTIQIADILKEKGIEVDRKKIVIKDSVKEVGKYNAIVKLHREVDVELPFEVFSE
ncbi:MAG: 50S ribosomal protein L9 [Bacteroidetes bacterium]|nr:MAG: 50S ribosomal protein L9 [Bacteroidota bacterium]RLD84951.1 MAG: 50S ribosomal protein L9 [Bacteroidota bacterium]